MALAQANQNEQNFKHKPREQLVPTKPSQAVSEILWDGNSPGPSRKWSNFAGPLLKPVGEVVKCVCIRGRDESSRWDSEQIEQPLQLEAWETWKVKIGGRTFSRDEMLRTGGRRTGSLQLSSLSWQRLQEAVALQASVKVAWADMCVMCARVLLTGGIRSRQSRLF
jgi:hypothetical protein